MTTNVRIQLPATAVAKTTVVVIMTIGATKVVAGLMKPRLSNLHDRLRKHNEEH